MHVRRYNIRNYLPAVLRPLGRSAAVRWLLGRVHSDRITRETVAWYRDLHADSPSWSRTRQLIVEMNDACRSRGIEFQLVVFPILHRLEDYPFTGVHGRLAELAREHGIGFLDLLPAFSGQHAETLWVHPTDHHPNPDAHRRAADHLARALGHDQSSNDLVKP